MTESRIIWVDVDGVLADFGTKVLAIANSLAKTSYTHDDICHWDIFSLPGLMEVQDEVWQRIREPGWARTLKPYPGSREGLKLLSHIGEVRILTSPVNSPTWVYDRNRWLEEHFGYGPKQVMSGEGKDGVGGSVLIDDKPSHVLGWLSRQGHVPGRDLVLPRASANVLGVLWERNYNQIPVPSGLGPHYYRTRNWVDVFNRIIEVSHPDAREQAHVKELFRFEIRQARSRLADCQSSTDQHNEY